jgi:radical SAM protein with 4Fe4S-binding SPASM domain
MDDVKKSINGLAHSHTQTVHTRPQEGETRDCLDPWYQPFIQPNGDVWPCCWFYDRLGNINDEPFDVIMNGPAFRALRRELLTGTLREVCANCPSRAITTPEQLLTSLRVSKKKTFTSRLRKLYKKYYERRQIKHQFRQRNPIIFLVSFVGFSC